MMSGTVEFFCPVHYITLRHTLFGLLLSDNLWVIAFNQSYMEE